MADITGLQDRKVYSFKSMGKSLVEVIEEKTLYASQPIPIGIKTPLSLESDYGLFDMHIKGGDQIADNLRNLLQTDHGQRWGFYDYGANLTPMLFEATSDTFEQNAMENIRAAVSKYMPYINLSTFETKVIPNNQSSLQVSIKITYSIPRIDNNSRMLELILAAGG